MKPEKLFLILRTSTSDLDASSKRKYLKFVVIKSLVALLDPIAIALVGLAMALLVSGFGKTPEIIEKVFISIGWSVEQSLAIRFGYLFVIGSFIVAFFLIKSGLSSLIFFRINHFLAKIEAKAASDALEKNVDFLFRKNPDLTFDQIVHGTISGTTARFQVTLSALANVVSDAFGLFVISIFLITLQPLETLTALAFFGLVSVLLNNVVGSIVKRTGQVQARAVVRSHRLMRDAIFGYRDLLLAGNLKGYLESFREVRHDYAVGQANLTFLHTIPRLAFEAALIIGSFLVAAVSFSSQDLPVAATNVVVFFAAASRIAPGLVSIITNLGTIQHASVDSGYFKALVEKSREADNK